MRPTKLRKLSAAASSRDAAWKSPWAAFIILFARARGGPFEEPLLEKTSRRVALPAAGVPRRRPRAAATRRARRRTMDHLAGTRCASASRRASAAGEHGPRHAGMTSGFEYAWRVRLPWAWREGTVTKVRRAAGPCLVHGPEHWIKLRRLPRPGAGILVGEAQFFTDIMVRGRCLCMSGTAMIRTLYTRVKTAIRGGHY